MWIDAHAHLDRYGALLGSALAEIEEHSVLTISNSMDLASYQRNLEIGAICPWVLPTFGIHPKNAPGQFSRRAELARAIEQTPMIGEIGLDFYWVKDDSQYPAQKKLLEYFLAAAREQTKIVNLHTKGAEQEVLDGVERYGITGAIVHWYSGPLDILHAMIDAGLYFTVGVEVLFSDHIREVARRIPLERVLTETDNPGGLKWLGGAPGMPGIIENIVEALAEVKAVNTSLLTKSIRANLLRLIEGDHRLDGVRKRIAPT
jgi:TatD DNase family protein